MLDVFRYERGKVNPSWLDNPRLVLERRLRDQAPDAPPILYQEFAIYRVSEWHYKVFRGGAEVFHSYRSSGGSGRNLVAASIHHVLNFIFHEEPTDMTLPPLSDKAADCLIAIHKAGSIKPGKLDYHGSIINRLQERQLIKSDGGRLALTLAGEAIVRETLEARQQPAENGRRPRKVRHLVESKAPEPEDAPAPPQASELVEAAAGVDAFSSALANVAIHISGGSEPHPAALIDSVMGEGEIVVCAALDDALVYELHPPLRHLVESLRALGVEPAIIARLQVSVFDARDPGDEEV